MSSIRERSPHKDKRTSKAQNMEKEVSERIMINSRSSVSDQSFYNLQAFHNVLQNANILQSNFAHEGYAVKIKFEDWTASNFNFQQFCKLFNLVKGYQSLEQTPKRSFFEFICSQNVSISDDFDNQIKILSERASEMAEIETPQPTENIEVIKMPIDINTGRSIAEMVELYGTPDAVQKAQSSYLLGEPKQVELLVPNGLGQSTGDPKFRYTIKFEIFAKNLNQGYIYPQLLFRNGFEFQISIPRNNVNQIYIKFQHEVKEERNYYFSEQTEKVLANLEQNDQLATLFLSQVLQSLENVKNRTTQEVTGEVEQKTTKEGRIFAVENLLYSTLEKEWLR